MLTASTTDMVTGVRPPSCTKRNMAPMRGQRTNVCCFMYVFSV